MEQRSVITRRWECQLLNAETNDSGVLLDLIALDPCPFDGLDMPAGWPFVLQIIEKDVPGCAELVSSWAEQSEIVALRVVYGEGGARWLDVAAADHHLILELR
jgi:hypothetical protein